DPTPVERWAREWRVLLRLSAGDLPLFRVCDSTMTQRLKLRRRGDHRTSGNKLPSDRIKLQIQSLERVGTEESHVSRFGEHDQIRRFHSRHSDQRVADVPVDMPAVGHLE